MLIKKGQWKILFFNAIYLIISLIIFSSRKNYEFILYVGIIVLILSLIILTNKKVNYPNSSLWLLSVWGLMHMLGGAIIFKGEMRLYELILIPLSDNYQIFRYDQLVHIIGFGVATLIIFNIIRPSLQKTILKWYSVGLVIIMAGLGVGALNEILEFIATVITPETGVGGYTNTSLDLVSDLIGAIIAFIYIRIKNR